MTFVSNDGLTSHDHLCQRLAGADVVGGHAFVGSAVAGSEAGDHQFSSLGGLRSCGQTGPAHPAPLKLDGVAAVGQALQNQGVSGPELHLVGQGGGVRGACARGTGAVFKVVGGRPTSLLRPLTLHLHLRVRLAVAVLVGGVADVLSRILPPHAGQRQDPIVHRVFPRQRGPEFGPSDDGRRGAWENKQTKEEKTEEAAWKRPSSGSSGDGLTAGPARHRDGVSLHHRHLCGADRSHRRSGAPLHEEFNFDLRHPFAVFRLADINTGVFWMDHGPLGKEGHCYTR